jgi:hypothetical protein
VWDSRTGTLRQSLATHEADVLALAVSADEGTVFGSGVDNKVSAVQFIKGMCMCIDIALNQTIASLS